ncbi:hypothetical protein F4779DRAFT_291034 [Xylariaceae sp. FL0662B]|nr:hypothetical protein F4779DRAFT_291034 [Xylariaceae sp. FL0662B]
MNSHTPSQEALTLLTPAADLANMLDTSVSAPAAELSSDSDREAGDAEMMSFSDCSTVVGHGDFSETDEGMDDFGMMGQSDYDAMSSTSNDSEMAVDSDYSIGVYSGYDTRANTEEAGPARSTVQTSMGPLTADHQNETGDEVSTTESGGRNPESVLIKGIFLELQRAPDAKRLYELEAKADAYDEKITKLESLRDTSIRIAETLAFPWNVLGLKIVTKQYHEEIADLERRRDFTEKKLQKRAREFCNLRKAHGIPDKLWNAYEDFCDSLKPKAGGHEGWIVTCDDHQGSYVGYDPDLEFFRRKIKGPYTNRNYRCHPGTVVFRDWCDSWSEYQHHEVELFQTEPIRPAIGTKGTWGEKYPVLYMEAAKAAYQGFEAAMQMLIALPDHDAELKGGWLFEYEFEDSRKGHPVPPCRWGYRTAHKIDIPTTVEEKRARLESLLWK